MPNHRLTKDDLFKLACSLRSFWIKERMDISLNKRWVCRRCLQRTSEV